MYPQGNKATIDLFTSPHSSVSEMLRQCCPHVETLDTLLAPLFWILEDGDVSDGFASGVLRSAVNINTIASNLIIAGATNLRNG